MTRILAIFCAGAAALAVTACDGIGRKYPPGYTDEGVKFREADWQFNDGGDNVHLWYFGNGKSDPMILCELSDITPGDLQLRTFAFDPLQQWPQPAVQVAIGDRKAADLPAVAASDPGAAVTVRFSGTEKGRLLRGIESGEPITITFADQTLDIPGPPQSMREAFATKCRGE